jgi:mannose-1-phosphate guanylyltransferase
VEAIILAGGQGKRLRPLTKDIPKCMVPVNGRPMLDYHLQWLKKYNVSRMVIACGYKWEEIKRHYGTRFVYSVEDEPLGTGGAIKLALDHIDGNEFLVVNCDDLNDVNLTKLEAVGSNAITLCRFHCRFGIVETEGDRVVKFLQKPLLPHWASMGLYLLNKGIPLPDNGALETETFPKIMKDLKAYKHDGFWATVNTMKDLEELEAALKEGRTIKPEF